MARVCCNFERALIRLREGKKVARENWPNSYMILQNKIIIMILSTDFRLTIKKFSTEDILAEDWYIL